MMLTMIQFETENLKLAALILSEIPAATFKVNSKSESNLKTICILHPQDQTKSRNDLIHMFSIKKAKGDIFRYNRALNDLRDAMREAYV